MRRNTPLALFGIVLLALLGAVAARAGAAPADPEKPEKKDIPLCADCHDQAKAFSLNPHARLSARVSGPAASPNAICESCHGDGAKHMEASGESSLIRGFHGPEGARFCLTCHTESSEHKSFRNGIHASTATVNCLSCHSIHDSEPHAAHLLAKTTSALCASCHPVQSASFSAKPFAHRLGRGGMDCVSCHDPHGRPGRESLKLTRSGELPCLSCHAEKRGPFVFEHVTGTAGDCLSCHEAHGSVNPKRLKRSDVSHLCLECHSTISTTTLGSQPPSFHNVSSPRFQNCTTCHVAIHGSNLSPRLLK